MDDRLRLNLSASLASVAVAAILSGLKFWAWTHTGSLSVAASMLDSFLDLLVSLTGLAAIFYAARPADEDHAFGHSSAEDLAALSQSALVAVSAGLISLSAIRRMNAGDAGELTGEAAGVLVMVVSTALTGALILWQQRVVRKTGNRVVAADSLHYIGDFIPGIGAIFALLASVWFGLTAVESVIALGASAMLLFGAWRIGRPAFDSLMDRRADPGIIAQVEAIARDWPGVRGFHDLKTRTAGSTVFIQIHIELDGDQTLTDAHAIGAALRRRILQAVPNAEVIIHKDPVAPPPRPVNPA